MSNSLATLTESRDWHGRWTAGDAGSPPDHTRIVKATFSIVSFTAAPSQQRSNSNMASSLHYGGRKALVNLLQTMTANDRPV